MYRQVNRVPDQTTVARAMAWAVANPAEMAWLGDNMATSEFAFSLAQSVDKYGSLTEGQLAAVRRNLNARIEAVAVSIAELEAKFDVARSNDVKKPRIRLDTFVFKAVIKGPNVGGIYVTDADDSTYLGKVLGGKFSASRDCSDDQKARIVAAASNPTAAAIAYGRRTGNCAICGIELTASESIERTVGPICSKKWGI